MATVHNVYHRSYSTTDDPDMYVSDSPTYAAARLQNIIYGIVGILNGLLAIRLVLALFAANPANAFANFIYTITNPFVAPFRGLFGINTNLGHGSRFEVETVVAMLVYALIGWAIVRVIDFARRDRTVV